MYLSMGRNEAGMHEHMTLNEQPVSSFEVNGRMVTLWYTPLRKDGTPGARRASYNVDIVDLVDNRSWFIFLGHYHLRQMLTWYAQQFDKMAGKRALLAERTRSAQAKEKKA